MCWRIQNWAHNQLLKLQLQWWRWTDKYSYCLQEFQIQLHCKHFLGLGVANDSDLQDDLQSDCQDHKQYPALIMANFHSREIGLVQGSFISHYLHKTNIERKV